MAWATDQTSRCQGTDPLKWRHEKWQSWPPRLHMLQYPEWVLGAILLAQIKLPHQRFGAFDSSPVIAETHRWLPVSAVLIHFWYSTPKLHSWSSYTTMQRYQNTQNTYQINRVMLKELSTHHYKFNSSLYPIEGQYSLHTRIFVCNKVPPTKCLWSWMCHFVCQSQR